MAKTTSMIFFLLLFIIGCNGKPADDKKEGSRLVPDPEHYIKDSPDILHHDSSILYTGWYYVVDSPNGYKRQLAKDSAFYFLDSKPIVTASSFTTLEMYESAVDPKSIGLAIRFNKEATAIWSIATNRSRGKYFAFILDNKLIQVSRINSQITGGVSAINNGIYSKAALENFKTVIESER